MTLCSSVGSAQLIADAHRDSHFNNNMVHQLQLVSSVPHSKYLQTISTLQALTGVLHPQEVSTYTLLTKPHNVFKPKFEPGKVNQIEQYYMRCTTIWEDDAARELNLGQPIVKDKSDLWVDQLFAGEAAKHWTLQICDIPNAGKNPVLAHNFYESTLIHHHTVKTLNNPLAVPAEKPLEPKPEPEVKQEPKQEPDSMDIDANDIVEIDSEAKDVEPELIKDEPPIKDEPMEPIQPPLETKDSFLQFLEDLGYDLVNQYWLKGIRFFHNDVVIEIYKVFVRDDSAALENGKLKLKLLDESNTFQIKAFINYPRGTSVDLVSQGTKQLIKMKELLHNLFELEVPDRIYLDSRVTRTT